MEKVTINFNKDDLKWDYTELMCSSIKNYQLKNRELGYYFPQINAWWVKLKSKIVKKLLEEWIKWEIEAWFITNKVNEVIFKILINNK
jgi:hypothetical protein